jgi:hypothetical protein
MFLRICTASTAVTVMTWYSFHRTVCESHYGALLYQVALRSPNASLSSLQQQLLDDGKTATSSDVCAGDGIASNVVALTFSTPGRSVFQATLSNSQAAAVEVAVDVTQPLSEPVGGAASKAAAALGKVLKGMLTQSLQVDAPCCGLQVLESSVRVVV